MKTFLTYISTFVLILSLISCDAIIFVHYRVKNTTKEKIKLNVRNYPRKLGSWGPTVDTIIELKPKESIFVGSVQDIGFPWDSKRLFYEKRGRQNFSLVIGDSIVAIDANDKYWRYYSQTSTFKIREKHLAKKD